MDLFIPVEQIFWMQTNKIYLREVAFGNEVWTDAALPTTHHSEADYGRVHDMGMNAVRFYLNYKTFEDDANPYVYKQTGWTGLIRTSLGQKRMGYILF